VSELDALARRIDELESRLATVEDERAIERLMYEYIHACDELKDPARIASFFTDDAIWEGQENFAEFGSTHTSVGVYEMFRGNPVMLPFTAHYLSNDHVEIHVDGDRAQGRWHVLEAATLLDRKTAVWMGAWYENDFVRTEAGWRISHLRYRDRFVSPFDEGWAKVRYLSPKTLEAQPGTAIGQGPGGNLQLGSIMLGSAHPEELKDWYRAAFGAVEDETGAFRFGLRRLFIEEHSEVTGATDDGARFVINLDIDEDQIRSIEEHLTALGCRWIRPVEREPFGLIGTVADPDGNFVQIIEWGAKPDAFYGS
jgi:ketosteroid isomerase-like protein